MSNPRRTVRLAALAFFFIFGVILFGIGCDGRAIVDVRFAFAGAFFALMGVLGVCGVNVWRGGPLDPRNDPPVNPL
jgi:hypothetical protein